MLFTCCLTAIPAMGSENAGDRPSTDQFPGMHECRITLNNNQCAHLTIDDRLQSICEQELERGIRHYHAKGGCMVVVQPRTGAVLAMVSRSSADIDAAEGAPIRCCLDSVCRMRYTPGSTFKVIGATAALDQHIMTIDTPVDCTPLNVGADGKRIDDGRFNYGTLTVGQILKKSSNPGAARVAFSVKWPIFREYISRFGLNAPVGIGLPGDEACSIADGADSANLADISHGQSVSVSPLHMAMVYAAIANDGVRMKPRLFDKILRADGSVYKECEPVEVQRVMSPATAQDLRSALLSATEASGPMGRGTATAAVIPGFRIGGKTGTAKKAKESGGYDEGLYSVSFVGILPIDDPQLVIVTVIDEPHPTDCNAGGGTVAAPIFRAAAERFIDVLNLQPADPIAYDRYRSGNDRSAQANPPLPRKKL